MSGLQEDLEESILWYRAFMSAMRKRTEELSCCAFWRSYCKLWNWSWELASWFLHCAQSFTQEIKIALTLRRHDQDVLRSIMIIHKLCKTHALVLKSAATEDHHKELTHEWRQNLQSHKISSFSYKLCHLPMPRARCLGRRPDVAQHYGRSRWEIFWRWSIRGDAIWVIYWRKT